MPNRILITGGAGFIGVNSARHFLDRGWEVTLLDNFSRKGTDININNLKKEYSVKLRIVRGDTSKDFKIIHNEITKNDFVLHLAGQAAVTTSIIDPQLDFKTNVVGTINLLEAIRLSSNRPPLIYSSTNKVYGNLEKIAKRETSKRYKFANKESGFYGVSENQQLDFHSPYGCSKGAADQYVIDYGRIYNLKTVAFRQSCIYGPHQFGVEDQGWLAWFLVAAALGRPITIYGNGKQVRDVLFVEDLTRLYELTFDKIDSLRGEAYNIGGGSKHTVSLLELINYMEEWFGYSPKLKFAPARAGDQVIFISDIRKIGKRLGWKPETNLKKGVFVLHEWIIKNKNQIVKVF